MRALLQRVDSASVTVRGEIVGSIERGLLVFLGVGRGDGEVQARKLAEKTVHLRIFPDASHSMNRSLLDVAGGALVVSQFTLYADCRKGRRPSFEPSEKPDRAEALYRRFVEALQSFGVETAEGVFGAHMSVALENDGPVSIWLDTDELDRKRSAASTSKGSSDV